MNKTKYLMVQDMLKKVLSMIFFVVLARFLSSDEFGFYQQVILISALFSVVFSAGVPVAISHFYGRESSYRNKISIFKRFFIFQLLLLCIGSILLFSVDGFLSDKFNNEYINKFIYVIITIFITNSSNEFFRNLSALTNQLKSYLYLTTTIQLISIAICISIVIISQNVKYILLTISIFNSLLFFLLIRKNLKYFLISAKVSIEKYELKYVFAMASVGIVSVLNGYVDQLMVSMMLSPSDYANLKIGAFQIPFIGIITGSLLTVMIPVITKLFFDNKKMEIIDTWKLTIEKATILLVPIVIFCLVFAEDIIISFFGIKYAPAIIVFQVYMVQWLRAVVIFGGVMGSIGLEKVLFKNTVVMTVLNVIINYFMIMEFGILGAAITTTFLNYFGALILIKYINVRLEKSFFSYFPFKIYFSSLLLSLVICYFIKFIVPDFTSTISGVVIASIIFYIVIILLQSKIIYNDISFDRIKRLI